MGTSEVRGESQNWHQEEGTQVLYGKAGKRGF